MTFHMMTRQLLYNPVTLYRVFMLTFEGQVLVGVSGFLKVALCYTKVLTSHYYSFVVGYQKTISI